MRFGLPVSLAVALIVLIGAGAVLANPTRVDSGLLQDRTSISYHAEWVYSGQDANALRDEVGGTDGAVNESEIAAYVEGLRAAQNGTHAPLLSWDGAQPIWWDLAVSSSGLAKSGPATIIYDGRLLINSSETDTHVFGVQRPASISKFTVYLSVPPPWAIASTTGLTIAGESNWTVNGDVAGQLATIVVTEAPPTPPPPPPPEPDNTPPVVNAGDNQNITLGSLAYFAGDAADNDPEFYNGTASFWWTFLYNNTLLNFTGQTMSFTFWSLGEYILTFSAMDGSGNVASDTLHVIVVSPDQEDPFVYAGEDFNWSAGEQIQFEGDYSDNDPEFPLRARFLWSYVYNGSTVEFPTSTFSTFFWVEGTYTVTFEVTDQWGNTGSDEVNVTIVRPDKQPPSVVVGDVPTVEATVPVTFTANVTDNDPGFPAGAHFWWTVGGAGTSVNVSGLQLNFTFPSVGTYWVNFTAVDFWGNRADQAVLVAVVSPDRVAPVVTASGNSSAFVGDPVRLVGTAVDNLPGLKQNGSFLWTFERDGVALNVTLSGLEVTYSFTEPGLYEVLFLVRDAWGNEANATFSVNVTQRPDAGPSGGASAADPSDPQPFGVETFLQNPLYLVGLLGIGLAGVGSVVAYRRRAARAILATEPVAAPAKPAHVVEAVLILNRDGRLIHFQASGSEASFESPEVIGSMFTAVTEFIRDSFGKDEALSRLTYGQNTIVLERSRHLFGAVIVYGEPDKQLSESLSDVLRRLEIAYAGLVERWTGDRGAFEGIEGFVAPLFALTAGLTRADVRAAASDKTIRIGSGTEHFKGYIRLRVAMVNQTDEPIRDARVTVLFNQTVLRLARIEPPGLKQEGFTVHLGDIAPGERLGASYYLDPQTCSQTNIEGVGTYTDAHGESQTVKMKPRVAEIVCPLFFTPEHANPAMMRRLIETALDARDSRVYRVKSMPEGFNCNDLFSLVREAVQRHHVVLVRNIKQKAPFEGNAWFYGQTKHSRSPVIIRATVSQKRRAVEFFVAVDSPATLTGMLAEFQRSFTEMIRERAPTVDFEQVMDDSLKRILSAEGLREELRDADESATPQAAGSPEEHQ